MKRNFYKFLQSDQAAKLGIHFSAPNFTILMPPVTKKIMERLWMNEDSSTILEGRRKSLQLFSPRDNHFKKSPSSKNSSHIIGSP
mmetsp:Transcript_35125/g.53866  ORF Transcript_35125/g.53866 Transcript_35125/m.53866 type:complete len:85 (+) Transcript_35125:565-819(+)